MIDNKTEWKRGFHYAKLHDIDFDIYLYKPFITSGGVRHG